MSIVNGILWLLDNDLRGPFNMVLAPHPVRVTVCPRLGHAPNCPAIFHLPPFAA